jgi:hypothetical protein
MTEHTPAARTDQPSSPAREIITGPNVPLIVIGLACIVIAALAVVVDLTRMSIDWSKLGPTGLIAFGIVLLGLGALGLTRRRG